MKALFIPLLATLGRYALASCDNVPPTVDGEEYDYVVIGSGPGGGPLA
jgi:hypothetical protein